MDLLLLYIFTSFYFRSDLSLYVQKAEYEKTVNQISYSISLHQIYLSEYKLYKDFSNKGFNVVELKDLSKYNKELSEDVNFYIKEFSDSILLLQKTKYELTEYIGKINEVIKRYTSEEIEKSYKRFLSGKLKTDTLKNNHITK